MQEIHNKCHRIDVHTPWMVHTRLYCFFILLADVTWPMRAGYNRCWLDNVLRPRLNLSSLCEHDMANAYRPWLTLHVVEQWRFQDAHMPCPSMEDLGDATCHWVMSLARCVHHKFVRAGLCWSDIPLADVACQIRICHVICVQWWCLPLTDISRTMCSGYKRF